MGRLMIHFDLIDSIVEMPFLVFFFIKLYFDMISCMALDGSSLNIHNIVFRYFQSFYISIIAYIDKYRVSSCSGQLSSRHLFEQPGFYHYIYFSSIPEMFIENIMIARTICNTFMRSLKYFFDIYTLISVCVSSIMKRLSYSPRWLVAPMNPP